MLMEQSASKNTLVKMDDPFFDSLSGWINDSLPSSSFHKHTYPNFDDGYILNVYPFPVQRSV